MQNKKICIFIYLMRDVLGGSSLTVRSPWHIQICCVPPYNRNRHQCTYTYTHTHTHQTPSFILLLSLLLTHFICFCLPNPILLPKSGSTPGYNNCLFNNALHHSASSTIFKVVLLGCHGLMHIVRGARRESS